MAYQDIQSVSHFKANNTQLDTGEILTHFHIREVRHVRPAFTQSEIQEDPGLAHSKQTANSHIHNRMSTY